MELENKVILVTGSSSGIGRETAIALAKEGSHVIVTYRHNKEEAQKVFQLCNEIKKSLLVKLDVREDASIKDCYQKIAEEYESIDILINNAGIASWKSLKEQTDEEIKSQIDTNLAGLIKMTKAALPYINKGGLIINISSGAGKKAHENLTIYCATKFGVRGFTEALALELPKEIKTYSLNPGRTATPMTNFVGNPPSKIADLILKTIYGEIKVNSGEDIDLWKFL